MKYFANPIPFSRLATLMLVALPFTQAADAAVVDIGGQLKTLGSLDAPAQSETADPALAEALRLVAKDDLDGAERLTRDVLLRSPASAPAFEVLGVVLAKRGRFDEALRAFEDAIRINPGQATAYTKIGDVHAAQGDSDKAFVYYQKAVSFDPAERIAHQRLGLAYEARGDLARAIEHFESGLIGAPREYLGIRINLAFLYNRIGRFDKTTALLADWAGDDAKSALAHRALGGAYARLGQFDNSVAQYQHAIELAPKDPLNHVGLGITRRDRGQFKEAVDAFMKALDLDPQSIFALRQLADTHAAQGDYAAAIARYEEALALSPSNATPITISLAEAQFASGDRDTAINTLQNTIQSAGAPPKAFESLGKMLQAAGQGDAAETVFAQMVERFPDDPRGYFRLGSHYGFVRDYAKALQVFQRGLEKDSSNPSLLKGASVTALRVRNTAAAVDYAQRLADLQPNSVNEAFFLGTVLDDAGRKGEAEAQYRRVLEKSPEHWPSLNNLAMLVSKPDEALSLASRAAELAPDSVPVVTTLGRVHFERGEYQLAASTYERALKLQQASPEIHRRLAETYQKLGNQQKALHHEKLAQ